MFKKKKTYVILIVIIAIIGGYYYFKSKKPQIEYTASQAEVGNLKRTVSVTGEITAPAQSDLSFKISGRVESLLADVGDRVEAGQKLATIDKGTLLSQLAEARHNVSVQKKTLFDMKRHKDTYGYYQEEAQRQKIESLEEDVIQIAKQIGDTILYSPISGMVIKKNVEVGEITVANAVTANTSVFTIAADGDLETQVNVPESDIVNVKLGQKAEVTLDALPSSEKISATVSKIEPSSTVIQDVVYYKVKLKFASQDDRFKVGMSTDADINTAEKDNVVMIPLRAVKAESDQEYVEILKENNITERKNVKTGLSGDDGMVEIVSGLSGGENVVTLTKNI